MSFKIESPSHWPITIPNATPTSDGVMSAADKAKLDSLPPQPPTTYDYVIVGYGTAGCPLANFLSADGTKSVLVLESGENYTNDPNVQQAFPVTSPNVLSYKYIFDYRSSFATPSANPPGPNTFPGTMGDDQSPRPLSYWAGRMWGGSSSHNYIQAVRGTPDTYDNAWVTAGGSQWSYNNLLPTMKWMENYTAAFDNPGGPFFYDPAQRNGTSPPAFPQVGPLFITENPFLNLTAGSAFVTAWIASFSAGNPNFGIAPDYNDPTALGDVCISAGQSYINPATSQRSSSSTAFAPSTVVSPSGVGVSPRQLTVISRAQVQKVNLEYTSSGIRATGVSYYLNGDTSEVKVVNASTKVILCAGAVEDPCILQRSGIGPASLLTDLGIEVFVDNANVGFNMENHAGGLSYLPSTGLDVPFIPPTSFTDAGVGDGVRRVQLLAITGQTLESQIIGGYIDASDLYAVGLSKAFIQTVPVVSVLTFGLVTSKQGNVTIVSSDPTFLPQINMNAYPDPTGVTPATPDQIAAFTDVKNTLQQICQFSVAWTGSLPILPQASIIPAAWGVGGTAVNDDAIDQYIYDYSFMLAHICSTCRMSPTAATGVVDGNLDVHGVLGLSVCSNAATPEIIKGNTAYSAYILGLKKAQIEGVVVPW